MPMYFLYIKPNPIKISSPKKKEKLDFYLGEFEKIKLKTKFSCENFVY